MSHSDTARTICEIPPAIRDAARQVAVPEPVAQVLPRPAYDAGCLARDLVAVLAPDQPQWRRIRQIATDWWSATTADPYHRVPLAAVRRELAQYYTFFRRFRRSTLRRRLLEHCDDDPVAAAKLLLQLLAARVGRGQDQPGQGLFAALAEMDQLAAELQIPFAALDRQDGGSGAGSTHADLAVRAWRVGELVPRLRPQYEPLRRRAVRLERCPWPDDLEIVPAELSRIYQTIPADHIADDQLFYVRAALGELRRYDYRQPVPEPPRHVVMLLDVSSSMIQTVPHTPYRREEFAIASAIALLEAALAGGHEVSLVRFDARPFEPITGSPAEIVRELLTGRFSAGGTCIDAALQYADELEADEIILVTDGEDSVHYTPAAPLTVYFSGGDNETLREQARQWWRPEEVIR